MSEMEAPEVTDGYEMDAEDLVKYAVDLLDACDDAEVAKISRTYSEAFTLASAYRDGLIDTDGITDRGHDHLADLYNDYENGE